MRPLVRRLAAGGVTANQVTLAAAVGSIGVALIVIWQAPRPLVFLLLPAWLFLRMALNAIDGMLAREFGQKSDLGAYLNELGDVVSDTALYAPFALVVPFDPAWVGIVVVLSILSEYAGVLAPAVGATRRYDGPLGKSDRAFLFGALAVWVALAPVPSWLGWLMPLAAVLLVATIVKRVRSGLRDAGRRSL